MDTTNNDDRLAVTLDSGSSSWACTGNVVIVFLSGNSIWPLVGTLGVLWNLKKLFTRLQRFLGKAFHGQPHLS